MFQPFHEPCRFCYSVQSYVNRTGQGLLRQQPAHELDAVCSVFGVAVGADFIGKA